MIVRFYTPDLPALDVDAGDVVEAQTRATAALRLSPGSGYWQSFDHALPPPAGVDKSYQWSQLAPPSISTSPVATVGS